MSDTFINRGKGKKGKKRLVTQNTSRKMKPYEYGYIDNDKEEQYVNKHKTRTNWKQQIKDDLYE